MDIWIYVPKSLGTVILWNLPSKQTLGLRHASARALWSTIKLQYQAALVPDDLFVCETLVLEN